MALISRRSVIKGGLAIPATELLSGPAVTTLAESVPGPDTAAADRTALRERLLLDFDWRFHPGHANDPAKDFGFSNGRSREFQKTGNFLPVAVQE
jgi:beta-galactosidase